MDNQCNCAHENWSQALVVCIIHQRRLCIDRCAAQCEQCRGIFCRGMVDNCQINNCEKAVCLKKECVAVACGKCGRTACVEHNKMCKDCHSNNLFHRLCDDCILTCPEPDCRDPVCPDHTQQCKCGEELCGHCMIYKHAMGHCRSCRQPVCGLAGISCDMCNGGMWCIPCMANNHPVTQCEICKSQLCPSSTHTCSCSVKMCSRCMTNHHGFCRHEPHSPASLDGTIRDQR